MNKTISIVIVGEIGSGKSYIAKHLAKTLSHTIFQDVPVYSFADALKKEYAIRNNIPKWQLYDRNHKDKHRASLIAFADKRKAENNDYFVNIIRERMRKEAIPIRIFDDTRFSNEHKMIIEESDVTLTYHITSDDTERMDNHTEKDWREFEFTGLLINDKDDPKSRVLSSILFRIMKDVNDNI